MSSSNDPLRLEYGEQLNGLVVVRQSPPADAVSFSATYVGPAGWGFDPPGREGTARLVNQLVVSGAGRYDRVALARLLDRAGAALTPDCAPESGEVTIWGPAAEWRPLLRVLADVVLRPRFASEDLERVRRQVAERQLRELAQPASRADRELFRAVYPEGHPYRSNGLGDTRSVRRIDVNALRRFHRAHYTSGDAMVVVTAPARRSVVESEVRRHFSEFAEPHGTGLRFPSARRPLPRTIRVPLPGRSEVDIRVGGDSIPRSDPEYPAAFLANEVLGGRAQLSRLFQRIRERGGLVYHASSQLEAMRFGGHWVVGAGTAPEHADQVTRMLAAEIDRMGSRTVPSRELREVRESAIGELPLALETTANAHELAVEVAYHRLPGDYLRQWPSTLRKVRPAEVRAAAEHAMDLARAVTVLAGPVSRT